MTDDRDASGWRGLAAAGVAAAAAAAGLAAFSAVTARRIEVDVPQDGALVDVDGTRIHYLDQGRGPAVVMIHGLGGQLRNFSYALTERLAARHRIVLIDRPGSGYSDPLPAGPATVRAQARVIATAIRRLGIERPVIVGHSLGGAVALAIGLDDPDLARGLALVAPLTQPQEEVPDSFRALAIGSAPLRRALSWTLATPLGLATRDAALRQVFAPEAVVEDFGTRGGGRLALRPEAFYAASGDLVAAADDLAGMAARYPALQPPAAILFGRQDAILAPALHGEATAASLPGHDLTLVDGGHMLPLTQPDLTARWLTERIARWSAGA
jgi:pimeloyl-ACP methyl ester carboxylesterase